jgi:hypothetical protein
MIPMEDEPSEIHTEYAQILREKGCASDHIRSGGLKERISSTETQSSGRKRLNFLHVSAPPW